MAVFFQNFSQASKLARDVFQGKPPVLRSPHWETKERQVIATHPTCEACGTRDRLQVHHIEPFHLRPDLELVDSNLMVLCEGDNRCHFEVGHHLNWKHYNPSVKSEAALRLERVRLTGKVR